MSELGSGTETADRTSADAVGISGTPEGSEAGPGAGYDDNRDTLVAEDRLPPRQDVKDLTWDDDPQWDDADLGEYDGDLDAIIAARDQLPTRQESFDGEWGDSPGWLDEADLEDQGDLGAFTDELPPRQDVNATGDNAQWNEADLTGEYSDADAITAEADSPAPPDSQRLPAEPAPSPGATDAGAQRTGDTAQDAASPAEPQPGQPELSEVDADADQQAAASDHQLASTDGRLENPGAPDQDAGASGDSPDQDAVSPSIAERRNSAESTDAVDAEPSRLRRIVSASNVGIIAAFVDAADTAAKFALHATPPEVAVPLVATLLGLGAVGLDKLEKRKREKP